MKQLVVVSALLLTAACAQAPPPAPAPPPPPQVAPTMPPSLAYAPVPEPEPKPTLRYRKHRCPAGQHWATVRSNAVTRTATGQILSVKSSTKSHCVPN